MVKNGKNIEIDSLAVFTFLWSNICILQCVKQYHYIKILVKSSLVTFDLFLFLVLISTVIYAILKPHHSSALFCLCFTHIISLVYQGSQSNHVIMGIMIALATLVNYSTDRIKWQKGLSGTLFLILVVLYFVSFIFKLNVDWFNPKYSCASLFSSGFLSMFMNLSSEMVGSLSFTFANGIISTAPHIAAFIEIALPSLLIIWKMSSSKLCFKLLIFIAAAFHLIICLPLPPLSVYPFSMVMVPMYVLMIPTESIQRIRQITSNMWLNSGYLVFMAVASQYAVASILRGEKMPLEYPAYGLWTTAIIWNITVWAIILYSVFSLKMTSSFKFSSFKYNPQGIMVAGFLGFIGICPYLGIRNYPALAMFSNLRTEGNSPNHLILPSLNILNLQKDSITIHSTNLKSLQNYQINLAVYFTDHSTEFNKVLGISNEFWITPPTAAWSISDDKDTKILPYSIPLIELRKHVSNQLSQKFYVDFSINYENKTLTFDSQKYHESSENRSDVYDLIVTPVSFYDRILFRFRSFDNSYSPCRH